MTDPSADGLRGLARDALSILATAPADLRVREQASSEKEEEQIRSMRAASEERRRWAAERAAEATGARDVVQGSGTALREVPVPPVDLQAGCDAAMVAALIDTRAQEVRTVYEDLPRLQMRGDLRRKDAIALPLVGGVTLLGVLSVIATSGGFAGFFEVLLAGAVTGLLATVPIAVLGGRFFPELAGGRPSVPGGATPKKGVWFAFRASFGVVTLMGGLFHLSSFGWWIVFVAAVPLLATSLFRLSRAVRAMS